MPWLAGMKPVRAFILQPSYRWSLEVDIDKYHHLIPVCLLGLAVFEKMQCQNNTNNQIMMNEDNKCLPPSVMNYDFAPSEGGKKKLHASHAASNILPPPGKKIYSTPDHIHI